MFGFDGKFGQIGGNAGPAVSGGSPVFQIASEQPSFLREQPFFGGTTASPFSTVFAVVAGLALIGGAYVLGRKG